MNFRAEREAFLSSVKLPPDVQVDRLRNRAGSADTQPFRIVSISLDLYVNHHLSNLSASVFGRRRSAERAKPTEPNNSFGIAYSLA